MPGLFVVAAAAGVVGTAAGWGRRFSMSGAIRGKRARMSRLSRCGVAGGATLGGVCLTIGIRVSRTGLMRGLPSETDTEMAAEFAGL